MEFGKLTEYLNSLEARFGIPALDCKITRNHEVVFRHMSGFSDYAKKHPVSNRDLYGLYSATKVITMVAVMQLMESGKLGLYDELRRFLPEFANLRVADSFVLKLPLQFPIPWPGPDSPCHLAHSQIRIIDLMSMTSGLSYNLGAEILIKARADSHDKATTREMVAAMARMPLLYEPRTRWSYSLAHDVLAAVVEAVSGMRFGDYLLKNVFGPLGLTDFHFVVDAEQKKRISAQYVHDGGSGKNIPAPYDNATGFIRLTENYESGGAGLIASVDAYSAVIDALANGGIAANGHRLLQEDTIRLFSTNYLTGDMLKDFQTPGGDARKGYGYGLGVRVHIDPSTAKTPAGEFGWDGAAGAYVLIDPVNHISLFYAQQVTGLQQAFEIIHPEIRDLAYQAMGF